MSYPCGVTSCKSLMKRYLAAGDTPQPMTNLPQAIFMRFHTACVTFVGVMLSMLVALSLVATADGTYGTSWKGDVFLPAAGIGFVHFFASVPLYRS